MFTAAAAASTSLSVIDPCNRTGKIEVPMSYVSETKGVSDFIQHAANPPPDAKDLSLCLLFQKGRCNAGSRCNQVHVTPAYIEQLRARASSVKSCCARHGDVHSSTFAESTVVAVHFESTTSHFSLADFAFTPALETALKRARNSVPQVQASRICRLHQRGSCKFGRDCKNIHLCPNAAPTTVPVAVPPAPVAVVAPPPAVEFRETVQPPSLGFAFRPLDISNRCGDSVSVSRHTANVSADYGIVKALSVVSIMEEFNSMRHTEADPLDIIDDASEFSSVTANDFDAFVDALVEFEVEQPLASPQWLAA